MAHYIHPLESCLARILIKEAGLQPRPVGAGVALHGEYVLTCAHVVSIALGLQQTSSEMPNDDIFLDFPFSDSKEIVNAKVEYWNSDADLAVLKVMGFFPSSVDPTFLSVTDDLWDHRVQAFGFPSKNSYGAWADCKLRGHNMLGWVEVFDPLSTGNYIRSGFSGGPVWDSDLRCVIGIVVAVEKNQDARVGYLIPAYRIVEKWGNAPVQKRYKTKYTRAIPTLLPYCVNRQKQAEDLWKLYERNKFEKHTPLPMLGIIHGDDQQAHDMFLARVATEFIPNLLKINPSRTPVTRVQLPWPSHLQNISGLSEKLTQGIAEKVLHVSYASCEEIQHALALYPGPVIFEMELLTDDWKKHKKGIIESILEFWNDWPSLMPNQHMFVFLSVTHKIPEIGWLKQREYLWRKKQIFSQIEHCAFQQYERIHSMVFSELANITESDVRTWAREEVQGYINGEITILLAQIRKLFAASDTLPMEPLALSLKEILASELGY